MTKNVVLLMVIVLVASQAIFAQLPKEEVKEEVPVILKALNQNNTLKDKIKNDCVIAVLFNAESATSENEKEIVTDILNDNKNIKIYGKKIKVIEIPLDANVNLEKKIIINKINAFWLTSGIQAYMSKIRESARYNQVITIASDQNLVTNSLAAMGAQKTEAGYKLLVNLMEIHNINIELHQNLLSEAIVIQ